MTQLADNLPDTLPIRQVGVKFAQKENLLVPDDRTALFSSPDDVAMLLWYFNYPVKDVTCQATISNIYILTVIQLK